MSKYECMYHVCTSLDKKRTDIISLYFGQKGTLVIFIME